MIINHTNAERIAQQVAQLYSQRTQAAERAKPNGAASASSSRDEVQLSEGARTLQKLAQAAANTPDVDPVRVQQLREQIESGNYKVPVDALVNKMLQRLSDQIGG